MSSDPHALLRPYYVQLRTDPAFAMLAPSFQFDALCHQVAKDQPQRAAMMREWTLAAQTALLKWLADVLEQHQAQREETLWTVYKDQRQLRCVAVYLPTGIDLRLLQGENFHRTELLRDAPAVHARAAEWLDALQAKGWALLQ